MISRFQLGRGPVVGSALALVIVLIVFPRSAFADGVGVPVNIRPPTISGVARAGDTLVPVIGDWTANSAADLTFITDRFEVCDATGENCYAPPEGGSRFFLDSNSIGLTYRVLETVRNSEGTSDPVASAPTAVVTIGETPVSPRPFPALRNWAGR